MFLNFKVREMMAFLEANDVKWLPFARSCEMGQSGNCDPVRFPTHDGDTWRLEGKWDCEVWSHPGVQGPTWLFTKPNDLVRIFPHPNQGWWDSIGRGICTALTTRAQFPDPTKWWERTNSRGLSPDLQLWAWYTHSQIHASSAPLRNPN